MTRSVWKGPFTNAILIKKLLKEKLKPKNLKPKNLRFQKKTRINTLSRNSTIDEQFVGKVFGIHNGRIFIPITITEDMISFKLGEFVPTRKKFFFKKKKIKVKKIVQKKAVLKTVLKKKNKK